MSEANNSHLIFLTIRLPGHLLQGETQEFDVLIHLKQVKHMGRRHSGMTRHEHNANHPIDN